MNACKKSLIKVFIYSNIVLLYRRRNEKPQEDHPFGNRLDAVQRHRRVLERSVGVDADVAVL